MYYRDGVLVPTEPAVDLVRLLSEGTYTSFPQALKEFISNAFDSDATRLDIRIDDDANAITIRDNGEGMTLKDFGEAFASIARSGKGRRGIKRGRTKSGRVKIGRFGIGTIAIVAICDRFSLTSSREHSSEGFSAQMDVAALRRQFGKGENLSDRWKFEANKWATEKASTHFTEIRLEGLSPDIRSFLGRPGERKLSEEIELVSQLSGVDQVAWHLGVICPVAYAFDYPIPKSDLDKRTDSVLVNRARRLLRDRFSVFLDGTEVRRRVFLPQYKSAKQKDRLNHDRLMTRGLGYELRCFQSRSKASVRYEGYVMVQAQQLFPQELRGLLVRLRGVAVGGYRSFHLTGGSISTMLPALSGEIWVDAGLEEALQFDRESFREDHPNFMAFREQIETEIEKESRHFRQRSERRSKLRKQGAKAGVDIAAGRKKREAPIHPISPQQPLTTADLYIDPDIFRDCPDFIGYLIPQINGCWDRQWFEACALSIRRLLETLIIHVYEKRGWSNEIKDSNGYLRLQNLINKVAGDGRVGLWKKPKEGLSHFKTFGDVAAHDYRVRVRRTDLQQKRNEFRLACERLIFIAHN